MLDGEVDMVEEEKRVGTLPLAPCLAVTCSLALCQERRHHANETERKEKQGKLCCPMPALLFLSRPALLQLHRARSVRPWVLRSFILKSVHDADAVTTRRTLSLSSHRRRLRDVFRKSTQRRLCPRVVNTYNLTHIALRPHSHATPRTSSLTMGSGSSTQTHAKLASRPDAVSASALKSPAFEALRGKRVVLASSSPRRKEILQSVGIHPEVVPSTFEEDLPKSEFVGDAAFEYPVETGSRKALEVYERLIREDPQDPPDLVIAADTVVIKGEEIMEKPLDPVDHARMIAELNDGVCEVVTGVSIIHPTLQQPGYQLRSLSERTKVHFAPSPSEVLTAYVESGEGSDRAGGFAIQGLGAVLVKGVEGDFNNVVGFPLFS